MGDRVLRRAFAAASSRRFASATSTSTRPRSGSSAAGTTRRGRSRRSRGPGTRTRVPARRAPAVPRAARRPVRTTRRPLLRGDGRDARSSRGTSSGRRARALEGENDRRETQPRRRGRAVLVEWFGAARGAALVLDLARPCRGHRDARRPVHGALGAAASPAATGTCCRARSPRTRSGSTSTSRARAAGKVVALDARQSRPRKSNRPWTSRCPPRASAAGVERSVQPHDRTTANPRRPSGSYGQSI